MQFQQDTEKALYHLEQAFTLQPEFDQASIFMI